jgi:hypothetical protein
LPIMKRKYYQWWSRNSPISTKRTITSHPNRTHWTQKKNSTYDLGNQGPGLGQIQQCGRVKLINGNTTYVCI